MTGYNLPPGVSERDLPGFELIEVDVACSNAQCEWDGVAENFEGEIEPELCPECGEALIRA